jgi:hypothetical protein
VCVCVCVCAGVKAVDVVIKQRRCSIGHRCYSRDQCRRVRRQGVVVRCVLPRARGGWSGAQLTDGDVVPRGHCDHPRRTSDNLLVVLLDVRLRSACALACGDEREKSQCESEHQVSEWCVCVCVCVRARVCTSAANTCTTRMDAGGHSLLLGWCVDAMFKTGGRDGDRQRGRRGRWRAE